MLMQTSLPTICECCHLRALHIALRYMVYWRACSQMKNIGVSFLLASSRLCFELMRKSGSPVESPLMAQRRVRSLKDVDLDPRGIRFMLGTSDEICFFLTSRRLLFMTMMRHKCCLASLKNMRMANWLDN